MVAELEVGAASGGFAWPAPLVAKQEGKIMSKSVLRIVSYQMGGTARFELDSIENPNFVEVSIVGTEGVVGALINRRQIRQLRQWLADADAYLEQGKLSDPEQPS